MTTVWRFCRVPPDSCLLRSASPTDGTMRALLAVAMGATTTRPGVLAIDDEPELLDVVKRSLEPAGFDVFTALSGHEGVEVYEKNWKSIQLVLLDFLMPEMTGDLVFECLKRQNPDVRTILLTGCDDGVATRMFQEGLFGYIHKPFHLEDFVRQVHEAVDSI